MSDAHQEPAVWPAPTARDWRLCLDGEWGARMCEPGVGEAERWMAGGFAHEFQASVPGHLQQDLIREGIERDLNFGENARSFRYREGKDWWLSRTFEVADCRERMELRFGAIDAAADAWLNGEHIGSHENGHSSWTIDVTHLVARGQNQLVVRLDDGSRGTARRETARYSGLNEEDMEEAASRMWLRKPHYVWKWDWAPRLLTCGIWRSVELHGYDLATIRNVHIRSELEEDGSATVHASCAVESFSHSLEGALQLTLEGPSGQHVAATPLDIQAGTSVVDLSIRIAEPALWWPIPFGEPTLYNCRIQLLTPAGTEEQALRHGIRTIAVERRDLGEEGESFTFVVNGEPLFCKGTGWNPPEHLFGCVDDDKLRTLIELAAGANLNMLRVNGCGTYESDLFYDLCDEHGVLVWQDFPFTCAYYPDDDDEFVSNVRAEAEDAVRRLRNHPSLALWCGSNETEWLNAMAAEPGNPFGLTPGDRFYGEHLYHRLLPKICRDLDPDRPYLPSTPWSSGGDFPNAAASGGRHAWEYQLMRSPSERIYFEDIELDVSKFVSEFGFLGPSDLTSLRHFIPEAELIPDSPSWKFHDNFFAAGVVGPAIERYWAPAHSLKLEDYLALGQLFQAEALGTAARHWRRRKFTTSGAISWGYVDCWGTTASWSLIDYYLRPRAAYFHMRRAAEPLQISFRRVGDIFEAWLVNDFRDERQVELELGYVDLKHGERDVQFKLECSIFGNVATRVHRLELPADARLFPGRFIAYGVLRSADQVVSRARGTLVGFQYDRLELPAPEVAVSAGGSQLQLTADNYVFQMHFAGLSGAFASDSWFDLLPGESRSIDFEQLNDDTEMLVDCRSFAQPGDHPGTWRIAELPLGGTNLRRDSPQ